MSIKTPLDLVDEFKKSGQFDALRRQLLADFQASERAATMNTRAEDIARDAEGRLARLPPAAARRELASELERHSVFERALSDATPPSLPQTVRDALTEILRANRRAEAGASMDSRSPNDQTSPRRKYSTELPSQISPILASPTQPSAPNGPINGVVPSPNGQIEISGQDKDPRAADVPSAIRTISPAPAPTLDVPMDAAELPDIAMG